MQERNKPMGGMESALKEEEVNSMCSASCVRALRTETPRRRSATCRPARQVRAGLGAADCSAMPKAPQIREMSACSMMSC